MSGFGIGLADIAILAVVVVSGLLAFVRGFVREALAIAAWLGAALVTLYTFTPAKVHVRGYVSPVLLADAITCVAVFLVSLVLFTLISRAVARLVQRSQLNALDRSLGFVFGTARGVVLVSLAYILLAWAVPPAEQPAWLGQARSLPILRWGAETLKRIVPTELRGEAERRADQAKREADRALEAERLRRTLSQPPPAEDGGQRSGYPPQERRELERLIETSP